MLFRYNLCTLAIAPLIALLKPLYFLILAIGLSLLLASGFAQDAQKGSKGKQGRKKPNKQVTQPFNGGDVEGVLVQAWKQKRKFKKYRFDTRLIENLKGFTAVQETPVNEYGGRTDKAQRKATGFFRTEKVDGRWWIVDPSGRQFFHRGVNRVKPQPTPKFKVSFGKRFGNRDVWANDTQVLLSKYGFNGYGCWTSMKSFRKIEKRLPYTPDCFFARKYAESKNTGGKATGHFGFDHELIPVFEDDFSSFCQKLSRKEFSTIKNDPYVVGYFTDNELQLPQDSLDRHLTVLGKDRAGYRSAMAWLIKRKGKSASLAVVTEDDRNEWIAHVMETYYKAVCGAIRKVDGNHMIIGSRFWSLDKERPLLWKVAGKYLDVVSVNAYGIWTPTEDAKKWEQWSGKPFIASEFYAKGMDSGLPNTAGAGWSVHTQADRGRFYQNYVIGLIESRACVGWHYFTYADNEIIPNRTDFDANKGIVDCNYEPWADMLKLMGEVNFQSYAVADWADRQK